jgi:uncharacterized protein (DUF885 family)
MNPFIKVLLCVFLSSPILLAQTTDEKFDNLSSEFLKGYFVANPTTATQIGVHDYDSILDDFSQTAIQLEITRLHLFREKFADLEPKSLSRQKNIDYRILLENIDLMLFGYQDLKEYEWNPLVYTGVVGNSIASLIYQDFAPLDRRLMDAVARAKQVPGFLENAKINLKTASKIHVETAIQQNEGNISLFKVEIPQAGKNVSPALQDSIASVCKIAIGALQDFGGWLQKDLLPTATRDPRLGKDLFDRKLTLTLSTDLTPQQILERAEAEKIRVLDEMYRLAVPLYKEYYGENPEGMERLAVTKKVLDKIVLDHPKKDALMDTIKRIIPDLEQFVTDHDLITLDPTQPLVIRETPEYEGGVAVASLEAPGPLEKNLKSFYNVMPIPSDWTPEQVESFLREYNTWSLRDLCMHEGVSGHYVQLYYSNRFLSIIRSVFSSGSMVEGWAVYSERMITDAGYMNNDPRMKLINLKWYLRTILNAIIDQKIHSYGMTEQEMMDLLMKEGFQEEREAAGKWRRANLTSVQLSTYFVGFQEIWDLRDAYRKFSGDNFTLKRFHETFLSYGSPAVKYLKELLLSH